MENKRYLQNLLDELAEKHDELQEQIDDLQSIELQTEEIEEAIGELVIEQERLQEEAEEIEEHMRDRGMNGLFPSERAMIDAGMSYKDFI